MKRALALLAPAVLVVGLAACGGDDDDDSPGHDVGHRADHDRGDGDRRDRRGESSSGSIGEDQSDMMRRSSRT